MRLLVIEGLEWVDVRNLTPAEAIARFWTCSFHDSISEDSNPTAVPWLIKRSSDHQTLKLKLLRRDLFDI